MTMYTLITTVLGPAKSKDNTYNFSYNNNTFRSNLVTNNMVLGFG